MSCGIKIDDNWLQDNKELICRRCKNGQASLMDGSDLLLDPSLDGLNLAQVQILKDLAVSQSESVSTYLAVEYDDAALGKLTFFDFAMINKLSHRTRLNAEQRAGFIEHLKDAFHVWNFISRSLKDNHFDAAIYINGNYSLNAVARERLSRAGVKCWSVEYSWANCEKEKRIYLERDRLVHCRDWPGLANALSTYQCNLADVRIATEALRSRIYGVDFNSYSSPVRTTSWDAFDQFNHSFNELVSIFVSSGDELLTHEVVYDFVQDDRFFKDQSEWLRFLINNANPEVGYVVRLHPRLKASKRDSVQAEEYIYLVEVLEDACKMNNFLIIEADDTISSYYILLQSELSVVSWSMVALESVALGIPTIACFPNNMSFPIETMGPLPESLDEIRCYIRREKIPLRTYEHELAMMKWVGIIYRGIGLSIPGIRYAKNFSDRILAKAQRFILSSGFLFSIFYKKRFEGRVFVSPNGKIRLKVGSEPRAIEQTEECLHEFEKFRIEARAYYKDLAQ